MLCCYDISHPPSFPSLASYSPFYSLPSVVYVQKDGLRTIEFDGGIIEHHDLDVSE